MKCECLEDRKLLAVDVGDIAFIGFNADGDDDFAIVALDDITNETIFFTDNELDGAATPNFNDFNEGALQWDTGVATIPAGTVVVFSDTDSDANPGFQASVGTLVAAPDPGEILGGMNLSSGGDSIIAYQGTTFDAPTTFIAAVQNEANNWGDLTNSGLTEGTTAVNFATSGSPDGGAYSAARAGESAFADYLSLIGDPANWTTDTSNGENVLPFNTTAFSLGGAGGSVTITESGGTTVSEADTSLVDTYDVALGTTPAGNVTVTVTADAQTEVSLDGTTFSSTVNLVFSDTTAQTITVRAVDDAAVEASVHSSTISHEITSTADATDYPTTLPIDDVVASVFDNDGAAPALQITEIMYNPASTEDNDWEFVEVVNNSGALIDFSATPYVLEDPGGDDLTAANITSGSVAAGGVAVFFNAANTSVADFEAAWGTGINLIPVGVDGVTGDPLFPALSNGGDTVGVWSSFADYVGDSSTQANAVDSVAYDDASPWPSDAAGNHSIYLTDTALNNDDPTSWLGSVSGVNNAYTSNAAGNNSATNIGSPGILHSIATGNVILTESVGGTLVSEDGTEDTYSIELDQIPAGNVTITVTADAQSEVSLDGTTFSSSVNVVLSNTAAQTITVRAVDDAAIEASTHSSVISHAITATNDPALYPTTLSIPGVSVAVVDNDGSLPSLQITEVMYNPASQDDNDWEYVEVVNNTGATIDFSSTPYVLDDVSNAELTAANITAGSIPAGTTAVLFNSNTSLTDFQAAWGSTGNFIAVSDWSALSNDGDSFAIWASLADYAGDQQSQANAVDAVSYDDAGQWPADDGVSSIYLPDVSKNNDDPTAWAISVDGTDNAYTSNAAGTNSAQNVGSPGLLPGSTGDTTPPTITDVLVSSTAWGDGSGGTADFIDTLDGGVLVGEGNNVGLSLPGPDQTRNLPWQNVDQIHIIFSEDIGSFSAADFSLVGLDPDALQFGPVGDYASLVSSVSYTAAPAAFPAGSFMATILLSTPLGATNGTFGTNGDRVTLSIADGAVTDGTNALDGEWANDSSTVSGNGTAGGAFSFAIDVLPGDVSNDSFVLSDDVNLVVAAQGTFAPIGGFADPTYDPFKDIISDNGFVLSDDVNLVSARQGHFLIIPSGGAAATSGSVTGANEPNDGSSIADAALASLFGNDDDDEDGFGLLSL